MEELGIDMPSSFVINYSAVSSVAAVKSSS